MWPNPQETAEEILKKSLMENFIFCAVWVLLDFPVSGHRLAFQLDCVVVSKAVQVWLGCPKKQIIYKNIE